MDIAALGTDAARGAAITLIALGGAVAIAPMLAGRGRRAAIAVLAAIAVVPVLVAAWAWSTGPWAGRHPGIDLVQIILAGARLMPWLLALALLLPDPVPPPALHAARLAAGRAGALWRWRLAGPGRRWITAALVLFPWAFAEFEIASRLAVDAWAVRLFDAQAGGLPLADTLARAVPGMALCLAILGLAAVVAPRNGRPSGVAAAGAARSALAWALGAATALALVAGPAAILLARTQGGWSHLPWNAVAAEAAASAAIAATAAASAWALAAWVGRRPLLTFVLAAPGCLGGIALGLTAATATAPFPALADTPLPWAAVMTLLLLPPALLLRRAASADAAPVHAARLLAADPARRPGATSLLWRLATRRRWLAWTALAALGCWELPASALLHPVAMTPLPVLVYNLMHYGESAAVAARLVAAVALPLLPAVLGWTAFRLALRAEVAHA